MSDIVKICKIHGQLTLNQCVINNTRIIRKSQKVYVKKSYKCRQCNKERCTKWQKENPQNWKKRYYNSKYTERYKELTKNSHLKRKFGITIKDYEAMIKNQNGVCAICFKTEKVKDGKYKTLRRLSVDHCHETGQVRGLLCNNCNRMLGYSQDSIEIHESSIKYLRRSKNGADK